MTLKKLCIISLIFGVQVLPEFSAVAKEIGLEEGGRLYVIQKKYYRPRHEIHISGGWLPQDAFWKGYTADLSYRFHVNDFVALEPVRGIYSRNVDTNLKELLLNEFPEPLAPDPFQEVDFMVFSHLIFTPLYGKSAFMNRRLLRQEIYLMTGAGGIGWKLGRRKTGMRPAVDFGGGVRIWFAQRLSFRLEVLENIHMKPDGGIDDMVYLSFGVTLSSLRK